MLEALLTLFQRSESLTLPSEVNLVEVSPRDGLQNEKNMVRTATASHCSPLDPTVLTNVLRSGIHIHQDTTD